MNNTTYTMIINAGGEYYKKFMLSDIYNYSRPLAVVTKNKIPWEHQYADAIIHVGSYNNEDVLKSVLEFSKSNRINGILTYIEDTVPLTAFLANYLNLNGLSIDSSLCARNKHLMRSAFERHGAPSAKSLHIRSLGEAEEFVYDHGYPVVLKPTMGGSSIGVVKISTYEDFLKYYAHVKKISEKEFSTDGLLIEEYLDGEEVSVESVIYDGEISIIAVTDKFKGAEPFFEETGHTVPSKLSGSIIQQIRDVAIAGIKALDIKNAVTHTEIKLTPRGPKIVEIGARPAGDFVPKLVELSTGVNMNRALVDIAMGKKPNLDYTKNRVNAVRFFVPDKKGIVVGHGNAEEIKKIDWVKEFVFVGEVGSRVAVPPDKYYTRLGHYMVEANSHEQLDERLKVINEQFGLEIFEDI